MLLRVGEEELSKVTKKAKEILAKVGKLPFVVRKKNTFDLLLILLHMYIIILFQYIFFCFLIQFPCVPVKNIPL